MKKILTNFIYITFGLILTFVVLTTPKSVSAVWYYYGHPIPYSVVADEYTITASSGANCSIGPYGATIVPSGGTQNYTITPDGGYYISSVTVDGSSVGNPSSYLFSNVSNNHTINADCDTFPSLSDLIAGSISPTSATSGVSTALYSTITNIGSATTRIGFTNLFQIDHLGVTTSITSTSPALGPGATDNTSISYTFPSKGTWSVRTCADNDASFIDTINESNEGNNCGPWTDITVSSTPPGVPVVSIFASPTSGIVNIVKPALTWGATNNPTSCNFTGDWTNTNGQSTTGNGIYQGILTQVRTYTYTLTCSNLNGASVPASANVVVSADGVVNGVCAATHYSCIAGTSVDQSSDGSGWSWRCLGSGGGTNAICFEPIGGGGGDETQCNDGVDNTDTEDTLVDTDDPGCHTDLDAGNRSSYDSLDDNEKNFKIKVREN